MSSSNNLIVNNSKPFLGNVIIPGDKSISHRSIILGSIAKGKLTITNFLKSDDCLQTISAMKTLGAKITDFNEQIIIEGIGLDNVKKPNKIINAGNSGTLIRLLTGILSVQNFSSTIIGDESLNSRPMRRIINPLVAHGAMIDSNNFMAPLKITGNTKLSPINYKQEVASAQVKSCLMLAALFIKGESKFYEDIVTRDHTENLLEHFGYEIYKSEHEIRFKGCQSLLAKDVNIGSDISSAAFFIVAALILKNSEIKIPNVNINKYRTGIITVLKEMGANISIINKRSDSNEELGDLIVKSSQLKSINIGGEIISTLIDELPILFIACAVSSGISKISGIEELRHKESDRIKSMEEGLIAIGIKVTSTIDSIEINGGEVLGGKINSYGDHRIAMAFAIAALASKKSITIIDTKNISTSFPNFIDLMRQQRADIYEV
jgi:3-phosphoshikimate 1-carboxyvinyltransferase